VIGWPGPASDRARPQHPLISNEWAPRDNENLLKWLVRARRMPAPTSRDLAGTFERL
jgi:hypothetical protein